jgi:TPP-dependent pyruvate/acetoin dehydrogenase alpha subunit
VKTQADGITFDRGLLIDFYRTIRLSRRFGEVGIALYHEGFIHGYFHSYIGQEAVAAGVCRALRMDDYIVSTHRGHGHCIAKGADINRMMAELFGRVDGYSHGRGGSMHMADHDSYNIGTSGIVGAGIAIATGVGMGIRQERSDRVVACFFGDGAANNGVFGESLNLAAIYALPVLFILENNCYAATTPAAETALCERFSDRGAGYGVPGVTVFGNDPREVYEATCKAVVRAREGAGPTLIEAETYRHYGHHVNDPGLYMPEDERAVWKKRDPLVIARGLLEEAGIQQAEIESVDREIEERVSAAVVFAQNSPEPDRAAFLDDIASYGG